MNLTEPELERIRAAMLSTVNGRPLIVRIVGSFARGREVLSSDLDLLVQGPKALTLSELGDLREWFDESDLPYIVDIVDYHQVETTTLEGMLRGAHVILHCS